MLESYADILSVEEACEALKIGRNTIYMLLNGKLLKGYRSGRIWKIPKLSIEEYILNNANLSTYKK